jgi:hypothetical protein
MEHVPTSLVRYQREMIDTLSAERWFKASGTHTSV